MSSIWKKSKTVYEKAKVASTPALRKLKNRIRHNLKKRRDGQFIELIKNSPYFDSEWYLEKYRDVAASGMNPAVHYFYHGAKERRDPSSDFVTGYYFDQNADVVAAGIHPLIHFIQHGQFEGRKPKAYPSLKKEKSLIPGSTFHDLSISDPLAIARLINETAGEVYGLGDDINTSFSPLISLVVPIYNTPKKYFYEMIGSVFAQSYGNWQLCLVNDGSPNPECKELLSTLEARDDPRILIKHLDQNVGIAKASQVAIDMATGDYIGFLDHDDLLTPYALDAVVRTLRKDPSLEFIYTDHVMMGDDGILKYYARKPAWSPEFLLSTNYIVHFKVVSRAKLLAIGGLHNEIANVQDLGMSCRLAAANAKTQHLPKICYMWRDHVKSVASNSGAKPGIEKLLIKTYDNYLAAKKVSAYQTWPDCFSIDRKGLFKTEFSSTKSKLSIIVIVAEYKPNFEKIKNNILHGQEKDVAIHFISTNYDIPGTIYLDSDKAFNSYIRNIDCDYVIIINSSAKTLTPNWIPELTGYLDLDMNIGMVGGKVLDSHLRVIGGGLLLNNDSDYRLICGGSFDNEDGHWFIGQVASNVDALSGVFVIIRCSALDETDGLRIHEYGDAFIPVISQNIVQAGYRIVYNPWAKVYDEKNISATKIGKEKITNNIKYNSHRMYYERFNSVNKPIF